MKLYKIPHIARIPILNKIEKEAIFNNDFQDYLVSNQEIELNNKKFYCNLYHNKILENLNISNNYDPEFLGDANHYLITVEDDKNNFYQINFIDNIFSNHPLKTTFILNDFTKLKAFPSPMALICDNFQQNQEFLLISLISALSNIIIENINCNFNNNFNK